MGVALGDGGQGGSQLVQVHYQRNLLFLDGGSARGIRQLPLLDKTPQVPGTGQVFLFAVQGCENDSAGIRAFPLFHVAEHTGYLQQGGYAGCVAVRSGVEGASQRAQIVKMGHDQDIAGRLGAAGNEAQHVAAEEAAGGESVHPCAAERQQA